MKISAYAPASIGNVSVGFDLLGAALQPADGKPLGDRVEVEFWHQDELEVSGPYAAFLPTRSEENLAWRALQVFREVLTSRGETLAGVRIHLNKGLPIGSGLGSSATSVVASLVALNKLAGEPLDTEALLELMGRLEAGASGDLHLDNVAPCYLGGVQLCPTGHHQSLSIPVFENWYWVIAYPGTQLSTREARAVLPKTLDLKLSIQYASNLAGFIAASYAQNEALAFSLFEDVLAEPARAGLLDGFTDAKPALAELGAKAMGISGAGPSLFAVATSLEQASALKKWLETHYVKNELGFSHICKLDQNGCVAKGVR